MKLIKMNSFVSLTLFCLAMSFIGETDAAPKPIFGGGSLYGNYGLYGGYGYYGPYGGFGYGSYGGFGSYGGYGSYGLYGGSYWRKKNAQSGSTQKTEASSESSENNPDSEVLAE